MPKDQLRDFAERYTPRGAAEATPTTALRPDRRQTETDAVRKRGSRRMRIVRPTLP